MIERVVQRRFLGSWLAIAAGAGACDDASHPAANTDAGVSAPDAGAPRVDAAAPPFTVAPDRPLDSLDAAERDALCAEKTRRTDPCREIAVTTSKSSDDCATVTNDCHAAVAESGLPHACGTAHFGPPGECSVTVAEYLACLDAWSASLSCEFAGFSFGTPVPCQDVVTKCHALDADFRIDGKPRTCTPEERVNRPDTSDDIYGLDPCRPVPARLVVLGDSIAECTGVSTAQCAPHLLAGHLEATVAPNLVFESYALAGAKVRDLVTQMTLVAPGPGHVFVFIYAVGNDIIVSNFDAPVLLADFESVFAHFTDAAAFPDGATFLLNTQYTPLDECYAPGASTILDPSAVPTMKALNQKLFIDVAEARDDAVAVDQYPDFLGHGVNGNLSGCPYCSTDNTPWSDDGIHPNTLGHAHIAAHWIEAVDRMFATGCADAGK